MKHRCFMTKLSIMSISSVTRWPHSDIMKAGEGRTMHRGTYVFFYGYRNYIKAYENGKNMNTDESAPMVVVGARCRLQRAQFIFASHRPRRILFLKALSEIERLTISNKLYQVVESNAAPSQPSPGSAARPQTVRTSRHKKDHSH